MEEETLYFGLEWELFEEMVKEAYTFVNEEASH